eukprot:gene11562-14162_t
MENENITKFKTQVNFDLKGTKLIVTTPKRYLGFNVRSLIKVNRHKTVYSIYQILNRTDSLAFPFLVNGIRSLIALGLLQVTEHQSLGMNTFSFTLNRDKKSIFPILQSFFKILKEDNLQLFFTEDISINCYPYKNNELATFKGDILNVWTDGSFENINGRDCGGGGLFIPDANINQYTITFGEPTIGSSELQAINTALLMINHLLNLNKIICKRIRINTDSNYAISIFKQFESCTNINQYLFKPNYFTVYQLLNNWISFTKKEITIELNKVNAHTGIKENDIADQLAKQGKDIYASLPDETTKLNQNQ